MFTTLVVEVLDMVQTQVLHLDKADKVEVEQAEVEVVVLVVCYIAQVFQSLLKHTQ